MAEYQYLRGVKAAQSAFETIQRTYQGLTDEEVTRFVRESLALFVTTKPAEYWDGYIDGAIHLKNNQQIFNERFLTTGNLL